MKSIRNVVAGGVLAGGALLIAAAGLSIAGAADDPAAIPQSAGDPGVAAGSEGGRRHQGFGPERLFSKLGLSEEQKLSVKAIMVAARPQIKSLHERMRANHLKISQTRTDDPNYANVVAEVAQANGTLASQRTMQMAELRAQMYAVLTPAQKTQAAALEAQWAAHPHPGPWGPHEDPG